jgi:hypothetical protein
MLLLLLLLMLIAGLADGEISVQAGGRINLIQQFFWLWLVVSTAYQHFAPRTLSRGPCFNIPGQGGKRAVVNEWVGRRLK